MRDNFRVLHRRIIDNNENPVSHIIELHSDSERLFSTVSYGDKRQAFKEFRKEVREAIEFAIRHRDERFER